MSKHPMQEIVCVDSVHRFRPNRIVTHLLKIAPTDMNTLAAGPFSVADFEQFAQLIGYSVSGFCELSYASDKLKDQAEAASEALDKRLTKQAELEKYLRDTMRERD